MLVQQLFLLFALAGFLSLLSLSFSRAFFSLLFPTSYFFFLGFKDGKTLLKHSKEGKKIEEREGEKKREEET